jgi:hypothetical protein
MFQAFAHVVFAGRPKLFPFGNMIRARNPDMKKVLAGTAFCCVPTCAAPRKKFRNMSGGKATCSLRW